MRRGFNLLMAIFMLLLLSGLAVLTMKYVRIHATHYIDSYNKEQAELFADSVTEAAIMKIEGYKRDNGCLKKLHFDSPDGKFEANVTILAYYLYQGKDNEGNTIPSCDIVRAIQTRESHGYVLMELVVASKAGAKVATPIRITRRTLQRP